MLKKAKKPTQLLYYLFHPCLLPPSPQYSLFTRNHPAQQIPIRQSLKYFLAVMTAEACPICLETCRTPLEPICPNNHKLCRQCITTILTTMYELKKCPECRSELTLKRKGVVKLRLDFRGMPATLDRTLQVLNPVLTGRTESADNQLGRPQKLRVIIGRAILALLVWLSAVVTFYYFLSRNLRLGNLSLLVIAGLYPLTLFLCTAQPNPLAHLLHQLLYFPILSTKLPTLPTALALAHNVGVLVAVSLVEGLVWQQWDTLAVSAVALNAIVGGVAVWGRVRVGEAVQGWALEVKVGWGRKAVLGVLQLWSYGVILLNGWTCATCNSQLPSTLLFSLSLALTLLCSLSYLSTPTATLPRPHFLNFSYSPITCVTSPKLPLKVLGWMCLLIRYMALPAFITSIDGTLARVASFMGAFATMDLAVGWEIGVSGQQYYE